MESPVKTWGSPWYNGVMKRIVKVGDEFRKGQCLVRVTSVDAKKKDPVTYTWITYASGAPAKGENGCGSHRRTFEFFEGEGFTYHPA